jgi:hypothetical protein
MDTLRGAMIKLSRPSKQAVDQMDKMGVSLKDASGNAKSQMQVMGELGDAFNKLKTPQEKTAAAFTLFEEAGTKMLNVLKDGSAGMSQMQSEASKLGLVVTKESGEAAEKFNDDITLLGKSMLGLNNTIGASVIAFVNQAGVMEAGKESIASLTATWTELDDETKDVVISLTFAVGAIGAIGAAVAGVVAILPALTAGFAGVGGAVTLLIAATSTLVILNQKYNKSTEDTVKETQASNDAFLDAAASVKTLGTASNLTREETSKLEDANKGLKKAADNLNISLTNENGTLKTQADLIREIRAEKGKLIQAQIVQIKTTIAFNEAEKQRVITEQIGLKNITATGNALKQLQAIGSVAANSLQLLSRAIRSDTKAVADLSKELSNLNKPIKAVSRLKAETSKLVKENKKAFKAQDQFNQSLIDTGLAAESTIRSVENSRKGMMDIAKLAGGAAQKMQVLTGAFRMLADNIAAGLARQNEIMQRDFEVQNTLFERQTDEMEEELSTRYDDQIKALEDAEQAKIDIIKNAGNARLLALNEEFQAAKELAEIEFALQMEREREQFEIEKEFILEKTIDKEERLINDRILEEDFRLFKEMREAEHQALLDEMAANFADGKRANEERVTTDTEAIVDGSAKTIEQLETKKNLKLKELEESRNAESERLNKEQTKALWENQVAQFEATKAAKIAEIIASGISAAAQAFASLAWIPFVGLALGAAAAGVILGATFQSAGQVESQRPLKPASLMLAQGGVIGGNTSHAQGGVSAEIESGEAVIDKQRTSNLLSGLDSAIGGGDRIVININEGAIVGNMDDEMLENLAGELGRRVEARL